MMFLSRHVLDVSLDTTSCTVLLADRSPDLWVAVTQDLRQQLRGLMEAAAQLVQLLLHGEDTLLQLPIGVVPIGTEITHDHLHLLEIVMIQSQVRKNCSGVS